MKYLIINPCNNLDKIIKYNDTINIFILKKADYYLHNSINIINKKNICLYGEIYNEVFIHNKKINVNSFNLINSKNIQISNTLLFQT